MTEPKPVTSDQRTAARPVFVSYATADRKQALAVCKAIEQRGAKCWISCRDVEPGGNYQEEIVRAIRNARAMVLVFSDAANNSDEIKKELSLASRHQVPLVALRIEDVEPSDAFAYELSTRQWIDAFEGWDKSVDMLVRRLEQISGDGGAAAASPAPLHRPLRNWSLPKRTVIRAAAVALVLVIGATAWMLLQPSGVSVNPMQVRLAAFQNLSADLPSTFPAALRDEIISSFGKAQGGHVVISTAAAPPPGSAPAYAFGGTARQDGDNIRVIARVTDERSGTMLWSNEFSYPGKTLDKIPRWFAVDTSRVIGCALFAVSTHPETLPEKTLMLVFDLCGSDSWGQALDSARRVVAASPDFSAGWSSLAESAASFRRQVPAGPQKQALAREAAAAADRALRLDPENSEAYIAQTRLVPSGDLAAREALLKKALAARPHASGKERLLYGWFLLDVGRTREAYTELQRAIDMNPMQWQAEETLGDIVIILGMSAQRARQHYDNAAEMVYDAQLANRMKLRSAVMAGDLAGALQEVQADTDLQPPPDLQAALITTIEANLSGNLTAKAKAAAMVAALPRDFIGQITMRALGGLGANALALQQAEEIEETGRTAHTRMWLWFPEMAGALRDPSFPGVAERLGLMRYWKTTHTKPDVCSANNAPPFCRMI